MANRWTMDEKARFNDFYTDIAYYNQLISMSR